MAEVSSNPGIFLGSVAGWRGLRLRRWRCSPPCRPADTLVGTVGALLRRCQWHAPLAARRSLAQRLARAACAGWSGTPARVFNRVEPAGLREGKGKEQSRRTSRLTKKRRTCEETTEMGPKQSSEHKFAAQAEGKPLLVYQLGTNNWQREGEYAPGSGILHEAHHDGYQALEGVTCYSMYPSEKQTPHEDPYVEVFKLDHPIPICESASPVSSYRWHSMSEDEFAAYQARLEEAVYKQMEAAEEREGTHFSVAIAHHTFLNPLVLRNVLRRRKEAGKPRTALVDFVHGTALKMYVHEKEGKEPEEFPMRFLPMMEKAKVFDFTDDCGVQLCYAISNQQIEAFLEIFPGYPKDRVVISPNGINQAVFHEQEGESVSKTLSEFATSHYEGSPRELAQIDGSKYDHVVVMVSKFAAWKRVPALLRAAKSYEKAFEGKVATVIVGTGPLDAQKELQDLAFDELGLEHTYFLGPKPQPVLARLYTIASVGVFPSYKEPFGMVFVECMACGTPVIGANSGGPKDFVDDSVGMLVPETDDIEELARSVDQAVQAAIKDDWKSKRAAACKKLVDERYSVKKQVSELLEGTRKTLKI
ncbi:D-inositol 3-phosphate glycosyltransferase (N-acetylglucosamine-inositol-phosphate N-acetylglucosaminyltransferase) (GlcNAc-Ins-P N-acetylglucosaminyltransferase) [Durusdinium trenchii]|uniref:D-inositol 3-phosphate glycosyltransferase (N-acetylglucosamine-inositol-phosphate N-acetylglucosaminyltransferase) (GlcNAc-Ins-P N-acetylglucosaminyltransferase) n=1 Tax=Durusdinium trenchii TaxID=1381693 RepID=A0ABP0JTA9_9DINO